MRDVCDCHMHILDRRCPLWAGAVLDPPDASIADYTRVRQQVGITRCVVSAPSIYGADNSCTRDAIASLGIPAKGTAVLTRQTTRDDVAELDAAGFVAARFNCVQGGPWNREDILPIAALVAEFGWHVQVYATPPVLLDMAAVLQALPTPLLIEHMAHVRDPRGDDAQAYAFVRDLVERGKTWVKLSAPYLEPDVKGGQHARFATTVRAFVDVMPERLVWGSDWPHATESGSTDTARLFAEFCAMVGDERVLDRILVENPKTLYGFE